MKLGTRDFEGMLPQFSPQMLNDRNAQIAKNTKLVGGDLAPWKAPLLVSGPNLGASTVRTLYRFGQTISSDTQYWFTFPTVCSVVRGPVANDTEERTYWTDGVYPKKTKSNIALVSAPYPTNSLRMGLPRPAAAPSVSVTGTATGGSTAVTSLWVFTYVSSWGEESAPGPASLLTTWSPGQTATVTAPTAPSGAYDITKVRMYRSASGTGGTTYLYHSEWAIGTASVADTYTDSQLGSSLTTTLYDPPPDNMIGLTMMAGGTMAGFFGNTVCLSVPGVPYAWPGAYRQAMPYQIVGIAAFDNALVVGLTRGVYIITGTDPASVSVQPLAEAESCVSMRSMVQMHGGVVWASPNGLWFVGPGGAKNISRLAYTHDEWQALNPSSIEAYVLDGRYYASYNNGSPGLLIFEPDLTVNPMAQPNAPVVVTSDQTFDSAYVEKATDTMYIVKGTTLYKWDAGSPLTYQWRSKIWQTPMWTSMAYGKIEADAYPVTFRLIADGTQRGADMSVANAQVFTLPPGRAYSYTFEIAGSNRVVAAAIASSSGELGAG